MGCVSSMPAPLSSGQSDEGVAPRPQAGAHRRRPRANAWVLTLTAGLSLGVAIGAAMAGERPRLYPHQRYLEDVMNDTVLPLSDPKAMLAFVLESLPDRVKVYPTENYYYFTFYSQGVRYAGNIRLDMMDRDKGKLHFAYFEDLQEWKEDAPLTYNVFEKSMASPSRRSIGWSTALPTARSR